jgi:hypothetical protein
MFEPMIVLKILIHITKIGNLLLPVPMDKIWLQSVIQIFGLLPTEEKLG